MCIFYYLYEGREREKEIYLKMAGHAFCELRVQQT